MRRIVVAMFVLAFHGTTLAQTQAPAPQSVECDALDADYAERLPQLDQVLEDALAVARRDRTEDSWLQAKHAMADLASEEADYKAAHTERACKSVRFRLREPWENEKVDRDTKPFLLQFTHDAAKASGIGTLRDNAIPEGETELRIWVGFGLIQPDHLLRLRVDASGNVTGDVLAYFPRRLARGYLEGRMHTDARASWNRLVSRCGVIHEGAVDDACFKKLSRAPDWRKVHRDLVEKGVETLPDQDELPPDGVDILDGVAMVVEVRKGAQYRAYEYSNPRLHAQPEAQAAAEILRLASTVSVDDAR